MFRFSKKGFKGKQRRTGRSKKTPFLKKLPVPCLETRKHTWRDGVRNREKRVFFQLNLSKRCGFRSKTARSGWKESAAFKKTWNVFGVSFKNGKGSFSGQSVAAAGGEKREKHSGQKSEARNYQ